MCYEHPWPVTDGILVITPKPGGGLRWHLEPLNGPLSARLDVLLATGDPDRVPEPESPHDDDIPLPDLSWLPVAS